MRTNLVSILIPFKNVAPYFKECLQTIQNQDYTNWEVLAVNDHSTDNSLQIAQEFLKKDARFKVFNNKEKGIITALRLAYQNSKGHLITRMDADDCMTPNRLGVMVNALEQRGTGHLAVGKVRYFAKNGVNDGYKKYELWLNMLTQQGTNFTEIYKECVIPSPCWMVYKEDLDRCQAFTPNRYPEDYDLAFRFYKNKLTCIPCNEVLHHWRDYQSRTSRTSPHYAENSFLNIKLHYFLQIDYSPNRPLVVWGAGKKGKEIAKILIEKNIPFYWVCNNTKKINKDIYGVKLQAHQSVAILHTPTIIITVANEQEQKSIRLFCHALELHPAKDYYFFC